MKKTLFVTFIASLFMMTALFTGCQDPIYEAIREDVKPEEPTVSGNVGNVTRYTASGKEFLVLAADNGLRYKLKDDNSHGAWKTYSIPFSLHSYDFDSSSHVGEQLITVMADSSTLYLLSASYYQTSTEGISYPANIKLWGKVITSDGEEWNEGPDWTLITEDNFDLFPVYVDSSDVYFTEFRIFQTNSPMKSHRAAYIRSYDNDKKKYRYFQLNGTKFPVEFTLKDSDIIDAVESTEEGYQPAALSAVYFNGGIKFFTAPVATTNETYQSEATYYYYTNSDNKLYYSNGSSSASFIEFDNIISALATTADSILVGYGNASRSTGGIYKATLVNGKPVEKGDFETNAKFQITDTYIVLYLLNATPELKELDSALYASVTFSGASYNFDNVGLWSYYPERGNWNRE